MDDESEQERESVVFGEGQMDTEKRTRLTIRSIRESYLSKKDVDLQGKKQFSLYLSAWDTHAIPHVHLFLPRYTPVWVPDWKNDPSRHKESQSERDGKKLSPVQVLTWKRAELLHIQCWFKFTDHV